MREDKNVWSCILGNWREVRKFLVHVRGFNSCNVLVIFVD